MNDPVIGVAGATGVIGSEICEVLTERKVSCAELRLFASDDSAGEVYQVDEEETVVEDLDNANFDNVDVVFFATPPEVTAQHIPGFLDEGKTIIDTSGYFRSCGEGVPVVPGLNGHVLSSASGKIINPSAVSILLTSICGVVSELSPVKRIIASTYQGVSGAGKIALDELWNQTIALANGQNFSNEAFVHQIAFNCIPQIDVVTDTGSTRFEENVIQEVQAILGEKSPELSITAIRVPVFHAIGVSLNLEFEKEVSLDQLKECFENAPDMEVPATYPMHLTAVQKDTIQVGRIRRDPSNPNGINLWAVTDNLRKGSSVNAVEILEYLLDKK